MNINNFPTSDAATCFPATWLVRPLGMSDLNAAVQLFNRVSVSETGREELEKGEVRVEWTHPVFALTENTRGVWTDGGELVGYIEIWVQPVERMYIWGCVHPDYVGHGVGAYLLDWAHRHAVDQIPRADGDTEIVLLTICAAQNEKAQSLFTSRGFAEVRRSYRMRIDLDNAPASPELPAGIFVRRYRHPDDLRELVIVDNEAFKDHWGHVDYGLDVLIEDMAHQFDADNRYDPSLSLLAVDDETQDVVGVAINRIGDSGIPDAGHINTVGVLRAHRGRGLGRALLLESFGVLHERGIKTVTLGVDAQNLTGALRLYESVGMYPYKTTLVFEKRLREGVSRMTRNIAKGRAN